MPNGATRRAFLQLATAVVSGGGLATGRSQTTPTTAQAWPQAGYDAANTGHAPANTAVVGNVRELWQSRVGDGGTAVVGTPVVANDRLYVAGSVDTDNYVYSIDATTGTEQWRSRLERAGAETPVIIDDIVYARTGVGTIYMLDATDGAESGQIRLREDSARPIVVADQTLYTTTQRSVLALDVSATGSFAQTHIQQWAADLDEDIYPTLSPAVADGIVYIGSESGTVYAFNAADGSERWAFQTDGSVVRSSPAVVGDTVYVGGNNFLYAIHARAGVELWRTNIGGIRSSPTVADGRVYVKDGSNLYAVDADDGSRQWFVELRGAVNTGGGMASPTVVGDTVYVNERFDPMYGLDAADGTVRWSFETGDSTTEPIVVDGTVYAGRDGGYVYALTGTPDTTPTQTEVPTATSRSTPTEALVTKSPASVADTPTVRPTTRPAPRSEPDTPASTADQGGFGLVPFVGSVLGLTGVAVAGYRYVLDHDDDTPSDDQPEPRARAEAACQRGDTAVQNGEYGRAIEAYQDAVSAYTTAREHADGERAAALSGSLTDTEQQLSTARQRQSDLDAVRTPLSAAESSFQTAIAGHVRGDRVPARRDYRQTTTQYQRALRALDDAEFDVLEAHGGLTVPVSVATEYVPKQLIAWPNLTDSSRSALAEAGIGTLSELTDAGTEIVDDLQTTGRIDETLANRLRVASWWHGDDERTFTNRQAIDRRRRWATEALQMLS